MKKIKLLALVLGLSLALVACGQKEDSTNTTNEATVTPTAEFTNISEGGFYVNNKGDVVPPSEVGEKKVLEWIFEPACPGCIALETDAKNYIADIQGENTLIKYIPISFLGRSESNPDFVTYSDKAVGIINAMAQVDPTIVQKYISKTLDSVYVALHYDKTDQLPAFKETYESLGGTKWDQIVADMESGKKIAFDKIVQIRDDKELIAKIPDGVLATPLLHVTTESTTVQFNTDDVSTIRPALEEALK